ncbi:hypothetical protein BC827DRAFT_1138077 [Russula dissimulans]|nr:hypothetical protein BC827DRAFT_1138077 [Russula dissimulans]
MKGILVKIMVELLDVLALATRQIKQGRFKNFAKKLVGKNDVEAVLHRLDRLTMEESRMTAAQTMEVVHGLFNNMKGVMDGMYIFQDRTVARRLIFPHIDGKMSIDNIREALGMLYSQTSWVFLTMGDELQKSVRQWLSPPDPSINQNVACGVNHKMTATWFTEGVTYKIWKARGSLLWIRGKPGSGKSVLCSTIIEDLEDLRRAGLASLAYYYFDFKDSGKQDRRGLLASLLVQLSARSDASCEILNRLYSDHENGSRQPREDRLIQCLKEVLAAQKGEVYVIIDAVDECPNNYGMPTSREMVLELLNELASLQFSHVHFCITSRPEVDIRIILEPLTSHIISLHDEGGQRKDILDYINSVIESDLNTRRWREEDKQLVINALAQKADGM